MTKLLVYELLDRTKEMDIDDTMDRIVEEDD